MLIRTIGAAMAGALAFAACGATAANINLPVLYQESAIDFGFLNRPAVNAAGEIAFGRFSAAGYDLLLTNGLSTTTIASGLDIGSRWGINDHGQIAYSTQSNLLLRDGTIVDSAAPGLPFTPYGNVYINNNGVVAFGKQTITPNGTSWGVFIAQNGGVAPVVETDPLSSRLVSLQDLNATNQVLIGDLTPGSIPGNTFYRGDTSGAPFVNVSSGVDPLFQRAAMNGAGDAVFYVESPQFGLYRSNGASAPQPLNSRPEFDDHLLAGVAINDAGVIAQSLAKRFGSTAPGFAVFLGDGDSPLVQEGDTLLGRPVIGTNGVFQGSLNQKGQLALALNLGDDPSTPENDPLRVIVLSSAVPEPGTWLSVCAGFAMLGIALGRRGRSTLTTLSSRL